jgi:hypothetical protein
MSGDGKRSVAEWPKLPRPSSTLPKRTFAKTTTSLIHAILGRRETLFGLWPANGEGATEALYLLVAAVAAYFPFRFRTWRSSGKHNDPIP